ncbi:GTP cyclohydrolase II [Sphingomonas sinipercae]|uniref:GTP cyclohydrolase-2 n=1 Tax=Sphingomonas sinipercae TaxID=2714944 RepID=A0A6G7ZKY2_9SPHN|nr:GTP cyclohydrolase II [Sphingomonas sinipercae]QIL01570.1 GTP cyclohydrolase II [Sphingomonas sinipercae]
MSDADRVERAIGALKGGRAVAIGPDPKIGFIPVETATAETLRQIDSNGVAQLLISGERAAALSLANRRDAADRAQPVLVERSQWLDGETALALADPARDFSRAPIGPLTTAPLAEPQKARAALLLARRAGLLPALWLVDPNAASVNVTAEEIDASRDEVILAARARLPIEGLPDTQVVAFRSAGDGQEHVALLVGAFAGRPPLVRLHSECLTGDVFGSLKCDCGPQLKEALRLIAAEGGGVLLYLRQEGRGIGLANKLRAYALQDQGLDTVEANLRLGFGDDERDYAHAAAMLRALGIDRVRLLTNNASKVAGLEAAQIRVVERVGHTMPANPHNADYLETKRRKSGHLF